MLKRIDIGAFKRADSMVDRNLEDASWEVFYDEWTKVFADTEIYTVQLIEAIMTRKIDRTPREIRMIIKSKKSPAKSLGIKLRRLAGMMAENGMVLVDNYDSNRKVRMWRMVHVDPSQHL